MADASPRTWTHSERPDSPPRTDYWTWDRRYSLQQWVHPDQQHELISGIPGTNITTGTTLPFLRSPTRTKQSFGLSDLEVTWPAPPPTANDPQLRFIRAFDAPVAGDPLKTLRSYIYQGPVHTDTASAVWFCSSRRDIIDLEPVTLRLRILWDRFCCRYCRNNLADTVLFPCKHLCVCSDCRTPYRCNICRRTVVASMKLSF